MPRLVGEHRRGGPGGGDLPSGHPAGAAGGDGPCPRPPGADPPSAGDRRTDAHFDIYALTWEGEPEDIRFQAGETDAAQWMPLAEWEAVAGTEGTLCPARGEAYKQELYRRIALYLQGQREFS